MVLKWATTPSCNRSTTNLRDDQARCGGRVAGYRTPCPRPCSRHPWDTPSPWGDPAAAPTIGQCGIIDFSLSHSRSTLARSCRRALSAGGAAPIFASVSISMDRNATASGTNGWSRYGEFFINGSCDRLFGPLPASSTGAGSRKRLTGRRELLSSREVLYPLHSRHRGRRQQYRQYRERVPPVKIDGVFGAVSIGH